MVEQESEELSMAYKVRYIRCAECEGPAVCYQCRSEGKEVGRATVCVEFTLGATTYDDFHLCDRHRKEWLSLSEIEKARVANAMMEFARTHLAKPGG